jgi:predicted GTPase
MENKSSTREFILKEWDWESEEIDFINSLDQQQCVKLVSNMKKAAFYSSLFSISKYSIFALFIAVYTLRYFQRNHLSLIMQMIIIPLGIVAVISYLMLKRIEANPEYKALFMG